MYMLTKELQEAFIVQLMRNMTPQSREELVLYDRSRAAPSKVRQSLESARATIPHTENSDGT